MSMAQRSRGRRSALAVLLRAGKKYGTKSFVVDPRGENHEPLKLAEQYGWCWFEGPRCAITAEGMRELEPYRRDEPKPAVQWICPVCMDTVDQPEGETGLPERVSCPSCEKLTREQIERLLAAQQGRA
jgi:hypothetical protein